MPPSGSGRCMMNGIVTGSTPRPRNTVSSVLAFLRPGRVSHVSAGKGRILMGALLASKSAATGRSEEHTSELQSRENLVCRLLLEKKNRNKKEETGHNN